VPAELPVEEAFLGLWRRLHQQVVVHDRATGETDLVSVSSTGQPADRSVERGPAITPDGRYIAFGSAATNLVAQDTNPGTDIFVHDRETGRTDWVSTLASSGQSGDEPLMPSISDDGRFVGYWQGLQRPPAIHDRATGQTELLPVPGEPAFALATNPVISGDGRLVAFATMGLTSPSTRCRSRPARSSSTARAGASSGSSTPTTARPLRSTTSSPSPPRSAGTGGSAWWAAATNWCPVTPTGQWMCSSSIGTLIDPSPAS
jgi:hypothetical protein